MYLSPEEKTGNDPMKHRHVAIVMGMTACCGLLAMAGNAGAVVRVPDATTLAADLNGANEIPGPGDPDGSGSFSATIDRKSRNMCYKLEVKGIAAPTMAHIHVGDREHADIVVLPLATPVGGSVSACVVVPKRTARHLMLVPQEYYVNVHNADFPMGAVRGQLLK